MVKQERAVRTRNTVIMAAAAEFYEHGYQGTSLSRISKAADMSMGAVTFHFATKDELADAVRERGAAATAAAVTEVSGRPTPALYRGVGLTVVLARLLEDDLAVRASARLERENAGTVPAWSSLWQPELHRLLAGAQDHDALRHGTDLGTVTSLAAHLLAGAEAHVRCQGEAGAGARQGAAVQLAQIWELVLRGISLRPEEDGRGSGTARGSSAELPK